MFYILLIVFISSWCLTWCMRQYALKKQVLDIPNHRSAHTLPIPRGGGIAFVLSYLLMQSIMSPEFGFLILAGCLVAVLGFWDDHAHLSVKWRFLGHILAATLVLSCVSAFPSLMIFKWTLSNTMILNGIGFFYILWMINLYNFMDGIDGLAASEAVCASLGAVLLYFYTGYLDLIMLPLILTASVLGFLYWNWPAARIFMGDAGSGFLGLILAVFSIQAGHKNPLFFWCWLILLGVFIVDATVTLLGRLCRHEKVYEAHTSHAYQHAARLYHSHKTVTVVSILINVLWLWPCAMLVGLKWIHPMMGVLLAYIPLSVIALKYNAGKNRFS